MFNKKPIKSAKKNFNSKERSPNTSWESAAPWYKKTMGTQGSYYHEKVILPKLLALLSLEKDSSLLDLGCGQGILERAIPANIPYEGVDLSPSLLKQAALLKQNPSHLFHFGDITHKLPLTTKNFTHGAIVLALQNVEAPQKVIENFAFHLKKGGKLVLVLNHPCFRIPRVTSWGEDLEKKVHYRRVDRYLSSTKIPILTHPGDPHSDTTFSFHFSLSTLFGWLHASGFAIETMEEWTSDKKSTGSKARMEDTARNEFPLFLTLVAIKK